MDDNWTHYTIKSDQSITRNFFENTEKTCKWIESAENITEIRVWKREITAV
jgi:hypothetical protein